MIPTTRNTNSIYAGIKMKRRWTILIGFPILVGIFAANHIEYYLRSNAIKTKLGNASAVTVRADTGPLGHNTISIDESTLNPTSGQFVGFATLKLWDYQDETKTSPPPQITALNKRKVSIIGFMYPLQPAEQLHVFCLLRSTQTCCYGPRPQYNQYVLVESKEPVKFERLTPVIVDGVFFVDPSPDQGYIYRMTAESVHPINENNVDVDANDLAIKLNLPKFNFDLLESLRSSSYLQDGQNISSTLLALNGKQVIIDGYIVGRTSQNPPTIIVGKYFWDGVMQGTRPDFYNAAVVMLRNQNDLPPVWKQRGVFTGVLQINRDPNELSSKGIISVCNAVLGEGKRTVPLLSMDMGPFLPISYEIFTLIVFLWIAFDHDIRNVKRRLFSQTT